MPHVIAWDLETIPDISGFAVANDLLGKLQTRYSIWELSLTRQTNPIAAQLFVLVFGHHYRGNAEGSTLRRTLGVLLESKSGFPLRRVGSGKRITLTHAGERYLDEWMQRNAFVAWIVYPKPWTIEKTILCEISCPLNIQDNHHNPFAAVLNKMRREALRRARALPIANEDDQKR
jgi:hypothetical protein